MGQRACIIWLSGLRYTDIKGLSEVEMLARRGVLLEVEPSPITGEQSQSYQAFSGCLPSSFGFFDTLVPACHLPGASHGNDGYRIIEEHAGRDSAPKMLPDLMRAAGWTVRYVETTPSNLATCVDDFVHANNVSLVCGIFKCTVADAQSMISEIAGALSLASSWVGEDGLLALLSDTQPARIDRLINVNNFLAEMGVIERDQLSGHIDWSNSLAYFAGHGQLWINLLGRDPHGAVHPQDEYEEVRDTLAKALPTKFRDAVRGEPVIERVYRKEELYSGNYLFCAPDLVVEFKPGYAPSPRSTLLDFDEAASIAPSEAAVFAGVHPSSVKGFLLSSAPAMTSGVSLPETASLVAVVPTLLHALGITSVNMDGSAVRDCFSPVYLESHPIRVNMQQQDLTEEDEELVINRLRDLGYI